MAIFHCYVSSPEGKYFSKLTNEHRSLGARLTAFLFGLAVATTSRLRTSLLEGLALRSGLQDGADGGAASTYLPAGLPRSFGSLGLG